MPFLGSASDFLLLLNVLLPRLQVVCVCVYSVCCDFLCVASSQTFWQLLWLPNIIYFPDERTRSG